MTYRIDSLFFELLVLKVFTDYFYSRFGGFYSNRYTQFKKFSLNSLANDFP